MSFILDALKKSESDRQRQSGPALFEVKVAPPRTGLPLWAIAVAALLVVNLGIVGWMLLRHAPARGAAPDAAEPPAAAAPAAAPAAPAAAPVAAALPAPSAAAAPLPAPTGHAASSPADVPASAAAPPGESGAPPRAADTANPEDYAPATDPASPSLSAHVRRGTASGVPLYQEAATTSGMQIPSLRLDLHVYAPRPQDRFVMINMHRLREGESLPEGVHVDSITPEGAVLSYQGSRFLLTHE
jgi:general secretion pathway protein B